ncbi:MAG: hypothetical protein WCF84_10585 [Anaerolineae bacterium]
MTRTEILFAPWAVRALKNARGNKWRKLIDQIDVLPEDNLDALAFHLLMIRLNNCVTCDARKYMERGGCARCALTNLGFSKETEESLLARYRATRKEIAETLKPAKRNQETA